jgi:hypothetical protein
MLGGQQEEQQAEPGHPVAEGFFHEMNWLKSGEWWRKNQFTRLYTIRVVTWILLYMR